MGNKGAIGLIDSGVGGLTVLKEALRQLPNEELVYLGDTARCPYGPRPAEQVIEYTLQMAAFLMEQNIKLLVIACNTATAVALEIVREKLPIPVVGVILPGSRAAVKTTQTQRIGVIGTQGTIKSHSYRQAILSKTADAAIFGLACPKFVPLVESNETHSPIAKKVVAETLRPMRRNKVDTLILGCTHYPLLRPLIQSYMGESVTLIDSGAETVGEVSVLLDYFNIANPDPTAKGACRFYTTGSTKLFNDIANEWLNFPIDSKHIELGKEEAND